MKQFLITGADFRNKGGQSMLFITISELRKRFPGCKIYYPTNKKVDVNYKITPIYYNFDSLYYMHGGSKKIKAIIKSLIKGILKKDGNIKEIKELQSVFTELDGIIDVSGFNLSSEWNEKINFKFLEYIRQAKKYNVPMYLMPQSFGPFDYQKNQEKMDNDIKQLLSYCKVVYAREKNGYELLEKHYQLENVLQSSDLVLQNKEIILENLFVKIPETKLDVHVNPHGVALIPNLRSFEHGNKEKLLELYRNIIVSIMEQGREVYVFRHATEDLEACRWIKHMFEEEERVILLEDEFNCLEYSELVKQFDFIISSRYHAIVHALKQGVPCVALGWAIKYVELLSLFHMEDYVFNISNAFDETQIIDAILILCSEYQKFSKKILLEMDKICSVNCFDILQKYDEHTIKRVDAYTSSLGLCSSCGMCVGVCPCNAIELKKSEYGQFLPYISNEKCIQCGICHEMCPGKDYNPIELEKNNSKEWNGNLLIGTPVETYTGYAKDQKVREQGVSGGCVSAIIDYLLEAEIYDAAFCVDTYLYDDLVLAKKYEKGNDLSKTPLSRYVTVSHQNTVRYMLENKESKLVIVSVPCAVQGFMKVIQKYKLNRENYFFCGLVCDKTMTNQVHDYFNDISAHKLKALYFRTKKNIGWPGNVALETEEGVRYFPAEKRIRIKEYFQPRRCLYCLDKLNRYADIACGDDYSGNCSSKGGNIIFVYSETGKEVIENAPLCLEKIKCEEAISAMKIEVRKKNIDYIRCLQQETGLVFCDLIEPKEDEAARKEYNVRIEKIEIGKKYRQSPEKFEKIINKKPSILKRIKRRMKL